MMLEDVLLSIYVFVGILMFMFGNLFVYSIYKYPRNRGENKLRSRWAKILVASPVWPFAIVALLLYGVYLAVKSAVLIAVGKG